MSRVVRWTLESRKTFDQNLKYLAKEWDNQVINDFLDRVDEALKQIQISPELYPLHRVDDKVYKCVIHKRIILYYKIVDEKYIDLLTFWNTYQDADRLKL